MGVGTALGIAYGGQGAASRRRGCTWSAVGGRGLSSGVKKPTKRRGFAPKTLASIRDGQVIGIRAGTQPHRIIGIWAVVVEGRVFVRSWSLKPRSWFRTFQEEPRGIVTVDGREIAVRAVFTKSERLKDSVSRAYLEKYHTPGSLKFARDLGGAKSRATTTELVPL